jgi:quercetin dioxygenase-like cupin family protein
MGTQHAAPAQEREAGVYWLGPGEGDARWVLDELDTIKATAAQTGGLFALKESRSARGSGPPLHVHEREDEACYVIEGDVTLFVGDEVISATSGTWVYLPRRTPHSLRVDSDQARMLWLIVPGGFDSFFVELFPAATDGSTPSTEQPDVERMTEAAARYGVTVLGPPPGLS